MSSNEVEAVYASSSDETESDEEPSESENNDTADNDHIQVEPSLQDFHYLPLDHLNPSIRLIRLHSAKTSDGLLQCDIRHASIHDRYSCLSYVWGAEPRGSWILLNGRKLWVRRNLFNFLTYAQRSQDLTEKWLWIDALCIDQTTTSERNHQVQQMGRIYSKAQEVISWFGCNSKIARYLDGASGQKNISIAGLIALVDSPYWDRAWITQEIVLARRRVFMAKSSMFDGELIPEQFRFRYDPRTTILYPSTRDSLQGRSLIHLLGQFREKTCSDRRDLVYSLLALCGDGSGLAIDYDRSPNALAKEVLRACEQSFCLCAAHTVADVLRLTGLKDKGEHVKKPFARIRIPGRRHIPPIDAYHTCVCGAEGCDGTDVPDRYRVNDALRTDVRFAMTVSTGYLCRQYGRDVRLYVDADCNVTDFRYHAGYPGIRNGFRFEDHHWANVFDQQDCIINVPFDLLIRIALMDGSSQPHCARVSSPGTSNVVNRRSLLEFSVVNTHVKEQ